MIITLILTICMTDQCIYERIRATFESLPPPARISVCSKKEPDYVRFDESPECVMWRRQQQLNKPTRKPTKVKYFPMLQPKTETKPFKMKGRVRYVPGK